MGIICTTRKKKLKNNKIDSITYCKINDIINNPVLFPTEFKPQHFHQSNTCFFKKMEEISKFPELIKSLFKNPENFDPSADYFEIIYGNPKQIMKIENKFVCNVDQDGNKTLKYSKPFENACFLVILEKFYAQLVGGYDKLDEGGFEKDVYRNILGILGIDIKEYKSINNISDNKIFEIIKNSEINEGAFITTGKYYSKKIKGGHAYVIKGVCSEYNKKTGKKIDCIVVKNPQCRGNFEYEEIDINEIQNQLTGLDHIQAINNQYPKTGLIYMPINCYRKWFSDFIICSIDFKNLYPKTYKHFNLYKRILELYNMNSYGYYFDSDEGGKFVKTKYIPFGSEKEKLSIIKDININQYKTYSDNPNSYDLKINGENENVEISDLFGKKLETNYVISKINNKYELLTLDELLNRREDIIANDIFKLIFEIDEVEKNGHKFIKKNLTIENLKKQYPNVINNEELIKKCINELKIQTERISKIDNELARKREMDEYNKKIAKLEELFNFNTDVLVQLEN